MFASGAYSKEGMFGGGFEWIIEDSPTDKETELSNCYRKKVL